MARSQRRLETGRLPQTVKRRAASWTRTARTAGCPTLHEDRMAFLFGCRAVHFLSIMRPMPFAAGVALERGWEVASSSWQTVRLKSDPVPDGRSQLRFPTGMVLAREYP